MSAWAKPGVKCVCVRRSSFSDFQPGPRVYTIKAVFGDGGRLHATFMEQASGGELLERFRPIVTRSQEQDVSLFTHHLDGLPIGEDA